MNTLYRGVASHIYLSIPSHIEVVVGCFPQCILVSCQEEESDRQPFQMKFTV